MKPLVPRRNDALFIVLDEVGASTLLGTPTGGVGDGSSAGGVAVGVVSSSTVSVVSTISDGSTPSSVSLSVKITECTG